MLAARQIQLWITAKEVKAHDVLMDVMCTNFVDGKC